MPGALSPGRGVCVTPNQPSGGARWLKVTWWPKSRVDSCARSGCHPSLATKRNLSTKRSTNLGEGPGTIDESRKAEDDSRQSNAPQWGAARGAKVTENSVVRGRSATDPQRLHISRLVILIPRAIRPDRMKPYLWSFTPRTLFATRALRRLPSLAGSLSHEARHLFFPALMCRLVLGVFPSYSSSIAIELPPAYSRACLRSFGGWRSAFAAV